MKCTFIRPGEDVALIYLLHEIEISSAAHHEVKVGDNFPDLVTYMMT